MLQALQGIKIVDLTKHAPGPFCTMVLGDLGAEVTRVEQAVPQSYHGDRDDKKERRDAAFNALNRNKRSIALNLKHPVSQKILHTLCEQADVFVEGFRPGVVDRLGCDYSTISSINPRIVYCSISGFGQSGPYRTLAGHDINYISIGGALHAIGAQGGPPAIPQNILADYAAGGLHAAVGILSALMARGHTGKGQFVDISMTDGVIYLLSSLASEYFREGVTPTRGDTKLSGAAPYYAVYECSDLKYLSLGCIEPHFWEPLCIAIGRRDFVPFQHDESKYPEISAYLTELFHTKTRDEWVTFLSDAGDIAVSPVNSLDEVFLDPQVQHREHPLLVGTLEDKPVYQIGIGPKLSDTPGSVRSLGPITGEHTQEILAELGFPNSRIQKLVKDGTVSI